MQLRGSGELVKALQEEYFCEDSIRLRRRVGWDADALRKYFEDGGVEAVHRPIVGRQR